MIYTEQHRELMRSVTKFVESEINPHAEEWDYFPGPARVGRALRKAMEA